MIRFKASSTNQSQDIFVNKDLAYNQTTGVVSIPGTTPSSFTVINTDGSPSTTVRSFAPMMLFSRAGTRVAVENQLSNATILTFSAVGTADTTDNSRLRVRDGNTNGLGYTNDPTSFNSLIFTAANGIGPAFVISTDADQAFANDGGAGGGDADALTSRSGRWINITTANVNSDIATLRATAGTATPPARGTDLFLFSGDAVTPAVPSSLDRFNGSLNEIARGRYVEI